MNFERYTQPFLVDQLLISGLRDIREKVSYPYCKYKLYWFIFGLGRTFKRKCFIYSIASIAVPAAYLSMYLLVHGTNIVAYGVCSVNIVSRSAVPVVCASAKLYRRSHVQPSADCFACQRLSSPPKSTVRTVYCWSYCWPFKIPSDDTSQIADSLVLNCIN